MNVDDAEQAVRASEERIFAALRTRDVQALGQELTDDFVHSAIGGEEQGREAFLRAIAESPYRILAIEGEDLRVRVFGPTAILWGIQRARVALPDGSVAEAATAFTDCFVVTPAGFKIRHAVSVELPAEPPPC